MELIAVLSKNQQLQVVIIVIVVLLVVPILVAAAWRWVQEWTASRAEQAALKRDEAALAPEIEEEVVQRRFFQRGGEATGVRGELLERYRMALDNLGSASESGNTEMLGYYFTSKLAEIYAKKIAGDFKKNRKLVLRREDEMVEIKSFGDDFARILTDFIPRNYVVDVAANKIIERAGADNRTRCEVQMVKEGDDWLVSSVKIQKPEVEYKER